MGFFSSVDNREKRQDCPNCGGLGRVPEYVVHKDKKTGARDRYREWTKCRKCRGSGLK